MALLWLVRAALMLGGITIVGVACVALRLAAGPVAVTFLVRHVADPMIGDTFALRHASLAWSGTPTSALVLTLQDVALRRPDGSIAAAASMARVAVLPGPLLLGRLRPVSLSLGHASVALLRQTNGAVGLDRGAAPGGRAGGGMIVMPGEIDLQDVAATLTDRALGATWRAQVARLALHDAGRSGVFGQADMTLSLDGQASRVIAELTAVPGGHVLSADWTAFDPGRLGISAAQGAPDLPVAGGVRIGLAADFTPRDAAATLRFGPGRIAAASGSIAIAGGEATLSVEANLHRADLQRARLVLPPGSDGHAPVVTASGTAQWGAAGAQGGLAVTIDHIAFADLGRYWPAGAAASGRQWMLANANAGIATGAHLDLRLAEAGGDITLTGATGQLQASDLTLRWLAPVPPLTHVGATLHVISPDALTVDVAHGVQDASEPADPPLMLGASRLRITGLSTSVQFGTVDATLAGPVAQAVALLRENRLHLLARHPIALGVPGGTLALHVHVALPLDARTTIDQIAIRATGQLAGLHLGAVVGGRDLNDGALTLAADTNGLALHGTASLAGVPATVTATMDFRAGGPGQVVDSYTAEGRVGIAQLQAAGLPAGGLVEGALGYDARYVERRDGSGEIDAHADLRAAALNLTTLGWRKAMDQQGSAAARVLLDHGHIAAIDRLTITGPDLDVQGHASYVVGQPVRLTLDPVRLGATRAAGTVTFPTPTQPRLTAELHGSVLDLGPRLQGGADRPTPTRQQAVAAAAARRSAAGRGGGRGHPWAASLHFDRVLLGGRLALADVTAHAENDGVVVRRAQMSGQAGTGRFVLTVSPQGAGRRLTAAAADAGGLMQALDLTGAVRGGTLALDAHYDDSTPDHPLTGTATVDIFHVVGAVAVGRLLQAMTLYGLVDVLRGPGLGITHLQAPFRFADQVLTLDNARAFSSSLGFTAQGDIDLAAQRADLTGTVVPGYFFNTLPGKLPLLGKLFSSERGGGLFAATYALSGPLAKPAVKLNPLAALAPGFLRGILGGEPSRGAEAPDPSRPGGQSSP